MSNISKEELIEALMELDMKDQLDVVSCVFSQEQDNEGQYVFYSGIFEHLNGSLETEPEGLEYDDIEDDEIEEVVRH
jgi:hypothetical protein